MINATLLGKQTKSLPWHASFLGIYLVLEIYFQKTPNFSRCNGVRAIKATKVNDFGHAIKTEQIFQCLICWLLVNREKEVVIKCWTHHRIISGEIWVLNDSDVYFYIRKIFQHLDSWLCWYINLALRPLGKRDSCCILKELWITWIIFTLTEFVDKLSKKCLLYILFKSTLPLNCFWLMLFFFKIKKSMYRTLKKFGSSTYFMVNIWI